MTNEDVIDKIEERSLNFLSKFADEFSVNRYTYLDYVLAVGDITGNTYCIRKDKTVIELDGLGEPYKSHCVIVPHSTATDRVAVLKLMIENDEENFLSTANTSLVEDGRWYNFDEDHLMVPEYEDPVAIYEGNEDLDSDDYWDANSDGIIATGEIRTTNSNYYVDSYRSVTNHEINPLYIGSNLGNVIDLHMIDLIESSNHTEYFYKRLNQDVKALRKNLIFTDNDYEFDPASRNDLNYLVMNADEFIGRCRKEFFYGLWNVVKGDDIRGYSMLDDLEMELDSGIMLDLVDELDDKFGERADNTKDEEELMAIVHDVVTYIRKECKDSFSNSVIVPCNLFPLMEYNQSSDFMLFGDHYITATHSVNGAIYLYYPVENFDEYKDYLMERVS